MKKYKILFVCVLVVALVGGMFAGCSGSTSTTNTPTTQTQDTQKEPEKIIIRIGHINSPGTPIDEGCNKFKELIEKRSNGQIEVQVFHSGQLGTETDMVDGLQMGSCEMVAAGDGPVSTFTPQYAAISMPFTFRDQDHFDNVLKGPIGEEINQAMIAAKNVRVVSWWANGPRYLMGKKPMPSPADLKGVKMRVPEMPVYTETWKRIGALAVPINFGELYTSLQQGVVDAAEQPLGDLYQASFHEITKYIMRTQHVFYGNMILISEKFYKSLTPELQQALMSSVEDARVFTKEYVYNEESNYEKKIIEGGAQFVDVDRDAYVKMIEGLPLELEKQLNWKPGLWQQIVDTK